jgi:hypothetical protein
MRWCLVKKAQGQLYLYFYLYQPLQELLMLAGVIESTGMTTQARSSYLPSEVLWGHRFEPLVSFKKETGEYEVDYSLFNNTYEVDTPLCSAKALDELKSMQQQHTLGKCTLQIPPPHRARVVFMCFLYSVIYVFCVYFHGYKFLVSVYREFLFHFHLPHGTHFQQS